MAISALAAGRRMGLRSEWTLTNLAMQKLLYIAHMLYMGDQGGDPLVSGNFEAWEFGPVHPELYHAVKKFGAEPITRIPGYKKDVSDIVGGSRLDAVVDSLSDSAPRLVAITHWERGAWHKNYIPGVHGVPIPNSDILQEYRDRKREPQ